MKFATLALIGTVAALNESEEILIAQKAELMQELAQIDEQINLGSTSTSSTASTSTSSTSTPAASTSTSSTTTPAASTTTTPAATTTTKKAESSNTGLIIGVSATVLVLAGVGFYVWKKKQSGGDEHEGGDDLYKKIVQEAWIWKKLCLFT